MVEANRDLTFILTEERGTPSFEPAHSDTLLNAYFIEQMVGTLLKHGFDGSPQGCLAESWKASEDRLKFSFKMRNGITCEDGTPITAAAFHRNLKRLFKLYIGTNKSLPVFENLEGFKAFRTGSTDEIRGIKVESNEIEFAFSTVPDGILAFLSMPYYGFYCDSNFNADGSWNDPHKIVASGQWKLESFSADQVKISRRKDWFIPADKAPDVVLVKMMSFDEAKKQPSVRTIIQKRLESAGDIPEGYKKFLSTPTDLKAVVLSPFRDGPLKNIAIRKAFREELQKNIKSMNVPTENAKSSISFYPGKMPPELSNAALPERALAKWKGYNLTTTTSNALTPLQLDYVQKLLTKSAEALGMNISFEGEDRARPGWKERLDELKDMDIRVVRVSVGGNYEPWVARMMFCSRMGVSFPDPSARIAELTKSLTDRSPETAAKFETIVGEDAAVIPLFHTSFSWLVSSDVGVDKLSPTSDLIRFELVDLR